MVAAIRNIFYLCTVKLHERHEVAASKQRFLCPILLVNSKRKEWANSNVPEVSARVNLTAPTALSLFNVKFSRV